MKHCSSGCNNNTRSLGNIVNIGNLTNFSPRMSLTLIQPRHNYAPYEGLGHVHLSAPLPSVKARLQIAGIRDIELLDANITPINYENLSWIVGFNLVGAPYIPEVLDVMERMPKDVEILLWGQIIGSLSDEEFMRIFHTKGRTNIHNGNNPETLDNIVRSETTRYTFYRMYRYDICLCWYRWWTYETLSRENSLSMFLRDVNTIAISAKQRKEDQRHIANSHDFKMNSHISYHVRRVFDSIRCLFICPIWISCRLQKNYRNFSMW